MAGYAPAPMLLLLLLAVTLMCAHHFNINVLMFVNLSLKKRGGEHCDVHYFLIICLD